MKIVPENCDFLSVSFREHLQDLQDIHCEFSNLLSFKIDVLSVLFSKVLMHGDLEGVTFK